MEESERGRDTRFGIRAACDLRCHTLISLPPNTEFRSGIGIEASGIIENSETFKSSPQVRMRDSGMILKEMKTVRVNPGIHREDKILSGRTAGSRVVVWLLDLIEIRYYESTGDTFN